MTACECIPGTAQPQGLAARKKQVRRSGPVFE